MKIHDHLAASPKGAPFTVRSDQFVSEAVAGMSEYNYGSAIVVDGDQKVIGILTERDVMKRLVNAGLDAQATIISEIMTSNPSCARETDGMEEWMRTMSKDRYRRIPVVDGENRIKAVLTQTDMIAYSWPVLMDQARELAEISARRNFNYTLIGGGILIYAIAMVIIFNIF